MNDDIDLYKVFIKKLQDINSEAARELRNIAEKIFLNSGKNKDIHDLGFRILEIGRTLVSYKLQEKTQ